MNSIGITEWMVIVGLTIILFPKVRKTLYTIFFKPLNK